MQHKTTLRVSDSRPNVNRFDRFKIFSSPPAHKTQNEGTGTQSPFSFEKKKKARNTLLKTETIAVYIVDASLDLFLFEMNFICR